MRFRRKTAKQRNHDKAVHLESWHKKFAWLPIRLTSDNNEIRWLEFVLRKGHAGYKTSKWTGRRYIAASSWVYADSSLDVLRIKEQEEEQE